MKRILFLQASCLLYCVSTQCQTIEKVTFNSADEATGYYLAVRPIAGPPKAAVVLFCAFRGPESIPPETKLHNVASANGVLTVYASIGRRIVPGKDAMAQVDQVLTSVRSTFLVDSTMFAVGGFDLASMTVLRYTERAWAAPGKWTLRPRAVFNIAGAVDLGGTQRMYERQIKKNFFPGTVGDAHFVLDLIAKEMAGGTDGGGNPVGGAGGANSIADLTPFDSNEPNAGNEQWLRRVAVRMYFDTDIEWQLKERRNGYYDSEMPDGAELINRLLLDGNSRAEFISARQPGMASNGRRTPFAYNIVDETEFIQWLAKELHLFNPSNPNAYSGPYQFGLPDGWRVERYPFPPAFAPEVKLKGFEELRLPAGWGVAGSEEYWSVAVMIWMNGDQKVNEATLREMLRAYYDGLIKNGGGPTGRKIPEGKMLTTTVQLREIKAEPDDGHTYSATVDMLDFMAMQPIRLNLLVHVKSCGDPAHFPVFWEASPKPFTDPLWMDLRQMKRHFRCVD